MFGHLFSGRYKALIEKVSVNDNVHFLNLASSGYDIIDSAEEPLWSKSDSEKDHLRCIPRQFKSRTDEASA
jgi:hypothetical protein